MEYSIGEFSILSQLTVKTLRYYQEENILVPSRIDSETNYRYYTEKELERSRIIRELKDFGFTLHDIQNVLGNSKSDEDLLPFLEHKLFETRNEIETLSTRSNKIEDLVETLKESKKELSMNTNNDITIKEIKAYRIASTRVKGAYSDYGKYIGPLFKAFGRWANGAPMSFYYDEEYKETDADFEVAFPVKDNAPENGTRMVQGGKVISVLHKGSYDTLTESYKAVTDFAKTNGYKVIAPTREIYLKGPGMFFPGNPKNYITEIQFPVEKE